MNGIKKVVITGGSGFLGKELTHAILDRGDECEVVWVSRDGNKEHPTNARVVTYEELSNERVDAQTVIINLAGAGIADKRWTQERKKILLDSRIKPTQSIVDWLSTKVEADNKPLLISGSAVGWYGTQGDKILDERSDFSYDFAHEICQKWEDTAMKASEYCRDVLIVRTGIVLSKKGGMLKKILPVFKMGLGGKLGNGQQYFSWVSLEDWVLAVLWLIEHENSLDKVVNSVDDGAASEKFIFNLSAPNPVTNAYFTKKLGEALHRPTIFMVPSFALELALGEMSVLLLKGQRVMPKQLESNQYKHQDQDIGEYLQNIV